MGSAGGGLGFRQEEAGREYVGTNMAGWRDVALKSESFS